MISRVEGFWLQSAINIISWPQGGGAMMLSSKWVQFNCETWRVLFSYCSANSLSGYKYWIHLKDKEDSQHRGTVPDKGYRLKPWHTMELHCPSSKSNEQVISQLDSQLEQRLRPWQTSGHPHACMWTQIQNKIK